MLYPRRKTIRISKEYLMREVRVKSKDHKVSVKSKDHKVSVKSKDHRVRVKSNPLNDKNNVAETR